MAPTRLAQDQLEDMAQRALCNEEFANIFRQEITQGGLCDDMQSMQTLGVEIYKITYHSLRDALHVLSTALQKNDINQAKKCFESAYRYFESLQTHFSTFMKTVTPTPAQLQEMAALKIKMATFKTLLELPELTKSAIIQLDEYCKNYKAELAKTQNKTSLRMQILVNKLASELASNDVGDLTKLSRFKKTYDANADLFKLSNDPATKHFRNHVLKILGMIFASMVTAGLFTAGTLFYGKIKHNNTFSLWQAPRPNTVTRQFKKQVDDAIFQPVILQSIKRLKA